MKKTPIARVTEWINVYEVVNGNYPTIIEIEAQLDMMLIEEKQVIIEAHKTGAIYGMNVNGGCEWTVDDDEQTEDYYNETYNNEN